MQTAVPEIQVEDPIDLLDLILAFPTEVYKELWTLIKTKDKSLEDMLAFLLNNTLLNSEQKQAILKTIPEARGIYITLNNNDLQMVETLLRDMAPQDLLDILQNKDMHWEQQITLISKIAATDLQLFQTTLGLLQEKERQSLLRFDNYELLRTQSSRQPETFKYILSLYPNEERLVALQSNKGEAISSILINKHVEQFVDIILELLPENDLLPFFDYKASDQSGFLHELAKSPQALRKILSLYPTEKRHALVVQYTTSSGYTPLGQASRNAETLDALLAELPQNDLLTVVTTTDWRGYAEVPTTLANLRVIKKHLSESEWFNFLFKSDRSPRERLLNRIRSGELAEMLELLSEDQKQAVLNDKNLLVMAAQDPNSLKTALGYYPSSSLYSLFQSNKQILAAATRSPESLKMILEVYPENERVDALLKTDVANVAACYPQSIKIMLELAPINDRAKIFLAREEHMHTTLVFLPLHDAINMLEMLPQHQRLDVILTKNAAQSYGLLENMSELCSKHQNLYSFNQLLHQLPEEDQFKLIRADKAFQKVLLTNSHLIDKNSAAFLYISALHALNTIRQKNLWEKYTGFFYNRVLSSKTALQQLSERLESCTQKEQVEQQLIEFLNQGDKKQPDFAQKLLLEELNFHQVNINPANYQENLEKFKQNIGAK